MQIERHCNAKQVIFSWRVDAPSHKILPNAENPRRCKSASRINWRDQAILARHVGRLSCTNRIKFTNIIQLPKTMSRYRRSQILGGTYFFTVALANRQSKLLVEHIEALRQAYRRANELHPFTTVAICILPEHIHAIWQLPPDDANYALRWSIIKAQFSRQFEANINRSASKIRQREKGIWQRRYWEHQIRDEIDLNRHIDYIHANPVKHGYVNAVRDWEYSSFHRYVREDILPMDWMGTTDDMADGQFGEL